MLLKNLTLIKENITKYCMLSKRNINDVILVAVSKKQSVDSIRNAYNCGQVHFGENFLQEALDKITVLSDLSITWHYIGTIQSNKTQKIANNFNWVHSVDSFKIAKRLSEQSQQKQQINICLQINIDNEISKSGFILNDELFTTAKQISMLANIKLRGLMCIPNPNQSDNDKQQCFAKMKQILDKMNEQGLDMDTLSMGMSDDYPLAIMQGATIIRIGTAIFGERHYE